MAEDEGKPLDFEITPGQAHDNPVAESLLDGFSARVVIADTAYNADETRELIDDMEAEAVIPPRNNRIDDIPYDRKRYKMRHKIEIMFGKMKHFRRIFSRFDKLDDS